MYDVIGDIVKLIDQEIENISEAIIWGVFKGWWTRMLINSTRWLLQMNSSAVEFTDYDKVRVF